MGAPCTCSGIEDMSDRAVFIVTGRLQACLCTILGQLVTSWKLCRYKIKRKRSVRLIRKRYFRDAEDHISVSKLGCYQWCFMTSMNMSYLREYASKNYDSNPLSVGVTEVAINYLLTWTIGFRKLKWRLCLESGIVLVCTVQLHCRYCLSFQIAWGRPFVRVYHTVLDLKQRLSSAGSLDFLEFCWNALLDAASILIYFQLSAGIPVKTFS